MRVTNTGSQKTLLRIVLLVLLMAGLIGCTVLPQGTFDPLAPALGLPRAQQGSAPQSGEAPTQQSGQD